MFKRKDDIRTFIVIVCICAICLVVAFLFNYKSNYEKLIHVNEYDVFFSNVNYLNNYISKIANNDNNAVYNLLDDKYIDKNNITIDNVIDFIGNYSSFSSFEATDMTFVQVNDDFIYYVQGKIYEETYEDKILIDDDYSIVIITDENNFSYSLYPVFNDEYIEVINGIRRININNNQYNSFNNANNINNEQICIVYLSNFISSIFNDINSSYDLLSDNMRRIYSDNTSYKNYINNNIDLISSTADKCKMEEVDDKRIYTVIDSNGNKYIFNEESVMNYKVDFYLKEVTQ